MPGPGSLPHDLGTGARLDEHGVALLGQSPEQRRDRHVERRGQAVEGGEAGRRLGVLDLRQHPLGDARALGQLADVEADLSRRLRTWLAIPGRAGCSASSVGLGVVSIATTLGAVLAGRFGRRGRSPSVPTPSGGAWGCSDRPRQGFATRVPDCALAASGHGRVNLCPWSRSRRSEIGRQRICPAPA